MSNISKSQIRPYLGREIPGFRDFNLDPNKVYNVLCPEDELRKAAHTFNNLPLTREHIEVDVDDVPKEKIVGSLGDHAKVEGGYLKNNLIIYDKNDIDKVLSGKKKELSCGYRYTPVQESGEYEGQHYDFKMTDIIGNHVALVKQGRAGRDVMVADSSKGLIETIKEKIMAVFDKDLVGDEFVESEHPRANNGQFTNKGSGSGSNSGEGRNGFKKADGGYYERDYGNGWYASIEKEKPVSGEKESYYLKATISEPNGHMETKTYHYSDFDSTFNKVNQYVEEQVKKKENGSDVQKWVDKIEKDAGRELSNQEKVEALRDDDFTKEEILEGTDIPKESVEKVFGKTESSEKEKSSGKFRDESDLSVKETAEIIGEYVNQGKGRKRLILQAVKKDYPNMDDKVLEAGFERYKNLIGFGLDSTEELESIPEKQDEPKKAGVESALKQGEQKMADEVKEEVKTEEKVEAPAEEKPVEDACSKDAEIKVESKKEEEVVEDKDEKDLKGKEKEAFAEGVDFGEKKEKEEPKKLDSEHESEGTKKADDKKDEMAKDSALVMDADALRAEGRAQAMEDYKAREVARKAVRSIVGDVDVFAFDSADEIYKFACKEAGLNCEEIASYKDAFAGLQAGKARLAMDASPVSGSNEECLKDIRLG